MALDRLIVQSNLALGGYDAQLLYNPENLELYSFATDEALPERDLVITLKPLHANLTASSTTQLLSTPLKAFIETGTEDLWLPEDACDLFASHFRLSWNGTSQRYTSSLSSNNDFVNKIVVLTFEISDSANKSARNLITLNVGHLTPPVVDDLWIFPLRRAANATQYTLGRSFLRAAYLVADYERRQFSIQRMNDVSAQYPSLRTIEPLFPANETNTCNFTDESSTTASAASTSTGAGLGRDDGARTSSSVKVAIGGSVPAAVVLIAGILITVCIVRQKRRKRRIQDSRHSDSTCCGKPELPVPDLAFGTTTHIEATTGTRHGSELAGQSFKPELAGTPRHELRGHLPEHELDGSNRTFEIQA
ncbi:MAG: hypothetical protein MMC23_004695 [Stictis urceolatum]|nr:hypothetical protein [Stictis urceolata]